MLLTYTIYFAVNILFIFTPCKVVLDMSYKLIIDFISEVSLLMMVYRPCDELLIWTVKTAAQLCVITAVLLLENVAVATQNMKLHFSFFI